MLVIWVVLGADLILIAITIGLGRAAARRGSVVIEFDPKRSVPPPPSSSNPAPQAGVTHGS